MTKVSNSSYIFALVIAAFMNSQITSALAADESSDAAIRSIVETFKQNPGCNRAGIALGVNVNGRVSIYTTGKVDFVDGHSEPVSASTAFEIGSITKTFTATIFAQLVKEGVLNPDSLVRDLLPPGTPVPSYKDSVSGDVVEITLDQLAHHTSGLPRQQAVGNSGPFDTERMFGQLDRIVLKTRPGSKYLDSQLGIALLAKVIERVTGQTMAELALKRVTGPMRLANTRFYAESDPLVPIGYDRANQPVDRLITGSPAYAGANALVSTLDDMMAFLAANMGRSVKDDPVMSVLPQLQTWKTVPCATAQEGGQGCADTDSGLVWSRLPSKVRGLSTIWKNGMTKGFAAWIGFVAPDDNQPAPSGVVVLTSQSSCPVGPMASCALSVINGLPPAPICSPSKVVQ